MQELGYIRRSLAQRRAVDFAPAECAGTGARIVASLCVARDRSARVLASAWTFAILLRIRARAAALRLVLTIFLQSSSTLADAIAYEQECTW